MYLDSVHERAHCASDIRRGRRFCRQLAFESIEQGAGVVKYIREFRGRRGPAVDVNHRHTVCRLRKPLGQRKVVLFEDFHIILQWLEPSAL